MDDSMKNLKDYAPQTTMYKLLCHEIQRKSVEKRKYIILQVPNANIVRTVDKNKSFDEIIFMCRYSPIFRLKLHYKKRE